MYKYFFIFFFFTSLAIANPAFTCNTLPANLNAAHNLITKFCKLADFKDCYFILNNSNMTTNIIIKEKCFFLFNQLENIISMPFTMYKKLLLLYKKSNPVDKADAVRYTSWEYYDNIKWPSYTIDNCTYLIKDGISNVESALDSKIEDSIEIKYFIMVGVALACFSFFIGYIYKSKKIRKKNEKIFMELNS